MSTAIAKDQAALMQAEGKLKKFFKAVKKLFAKEFLWVLFIGLLGLPLALIMTYLLDTYASQEIISFCKDLLKDNPVFVGAYAVSIAGIYFTRTVVGSINTLVKKAG